MGVVLKNNRETKREATPKDCVRLHVITHHAEDCGCPARVQITVCAPLGFLKYVIAPDLVAPTSHTSPLYTEVAKHSA